MAALIISADYITVENSNRVPLKQGHWGGGGTVESSGEGGWTFLELVDLVKWRVSVCLLAADASKHIFVFMSLDRIVTVIMTDPPV